jgi:hypothetical protein
LLDREKFDDGLRYLKARSFPMPSPEKIELWYEVLRNLDNDKYFKAAFRLCQTIPHWHEEENLPLRIIREIERQEKTGEEVKIP